MEYLLIIGLTREQIQALQDKMYELGQGTESDNPVWKLVFEACQEITSC